MNAKNQILGFVLGTIAGLVSCAIWSYIQFATGLFR